AAAERLCQRRIRRYHAKADCDGGDGEPAHDRLPGDDAHCTKKTLASVPAGLDEAMGVTICTTRAPLAALAPTLTWAVAVVPSALTTRPLTVKAGSTALFFRKTTDTAPMSPRPVIVTAIVAPAVAVDGARPTTMGSTSTDTGALTVSVAARGVAARTLTEAPTLRSIVTGGAAPPTLTGREASKTPNAGTIVTSAEALSVASSRCVAVMVTVGGRGIRVGAV